MRGQVDGTTVVCGNPTTAANCTHSAGAPDSTNLEGGWELNRPVAERVPVAVPHIVDLQQPQSAGSDTSSLQWARSCCRPSDMAGTI